MRYESYKKPNNLRVFEFIFEEDELRGLWERLSCKDRREFDSLIQGRLVSGKLKALAMVAEVMEDNVLRLAPPATEKKQ